MNYINSRPFNPEDFALTEADFLRLNEPRHLGLSGHMRVRNEALTLRASLDSCLPFLDELIITYHDSDDESEVILLEFAARYPNKIRLFWYPLEWGTCRGVMVPRPYKHLAHYSNFGYTKTQYSFYVKLDADQVYFTEKMFFVRKTLLKYGQLIATGQSITPMPVDDDTAFSYYDRLIAKAMNHNPQSTFILSGLDACYKDENLYIYTLGNLDQEALFNGVYQDTFIAYPHSKRRYYMQEEFFEAFPHVNQHCVALGLHWVHTGLIKRRLGAQCTKVIPLEKASTMLWEEVYEKINRQPTKNPKVHNRYNSIGRRFWNRDVGTFLTQEFYDKYFPAILKNARLL